MGRIMLIMPFIPFDGVLWCPMSVLPCSCRTVCRMLIKLTALLYINYITNNIAVHTGGGKQSSRVVRGNVVVY